MEAQRVAEAALEYFRNVLKKEGSIVGVTKTEDGWRVELETIDYRGAGFDPTLALYEATVDKALNVASYRRTHLRRSSQLAWSPTITE